MQGGSGGSMDRRQVDWETLDKRKFFTLGVGLFSGITVALYPLTVIKTRMMALDHTGDVRGLQGAYHTARTVVRHDGLRGLWKGFGVVIGGMIPARMVYLSSLEFTRGASAHLLEPLHLPETAAAAASSFLGGGFASLASQVVVVPIDVVSQRLMIQGGGAPAQAAAATAGAAAVQGGAAAAATAAAAASAGPAGSQRLGGLQLARQIVHSEGMFGLYRGFWASAATFVPNSALWWASYGAWQSVIWHQVDRIRSSTSGTSGLSSDISSSSSGGSNSGIPALPHEQQQRRQQGAAAQELRGEGEVAAVQAAAGVLSGFTTAVLTNPLDVAKTRLQTAAATTAGGSKPTWVGVVQELYAQNGLAGFYRGIQPRMISSAIWGTTMVSAYELLKRMCALPPPEHAV